MILSALAVAMGWLTGAAQTPPDNAREWFTLSVDGVRTGYALEERKVDHGVVVERASTTIIVRELGRRARITYDATLHSDISGHPIAFDYRQETGISREEWHGDFADGQLVIQQRNGAQKKEIRVDVPPAAIFSPRHEARASTPGAAPRIVFDPQRKTFITVDPAAEHLRLDASGRVVALTSALLGRTLTWKTCSHDCDGRVAEPMDAIGSLVVRSPVRIPDWYRHHSLRYVITRADGSVPDAVETFEQDVVRDGNRIVVTVCDDCGRESAATPADIERFLRPNAWVRSDEAQIRHIALGAAGGSNVREAMRSLTKFVVLAMRGNNDFLGYADAVTALRTGSGDCTEFAVLLAALARARGIPARIAVGLAYSDRFSGRKDVFSPHMWVQVWDGTRWTSYDAALEGFDSTHIALGISDGDPASVIPQFATLPNLRIEKAGVLRNQ